MPKRKRIKDILERGKVYRRAELESYSKAVDRELATLVRQGVLRKASAGVYYVPQPTVFGEAPPEDSLLVKAFLKDDHFLIMSPNNYNSLGVGTTQLYNERVVYNHKRSGQFKLGNRLFHFRLKPRFPEKLTMEFLLVDLVNNLKHLAEDRDSLLLRVKEKAGQMNKEVLANTAREYGGVRAKKLFSLQAA